MQPVGEQTLSRQTRILAGGGVALAALLGASAWYTVPHVENDLTQETMRHLAVQLGAAPDYEGQPHHKADLLRSLAPYGIANVTIAGHSATVTGVARSDAEIQALRDAATKWGVAKLTYKVGDAAIAVGAPTASTTTALGAATTVVAAPTSTTSPATTSVPAPTTTRVAATTSVAPPTSTSAPPTTTPAPPTTTAVSAAEREAASLQAELTALASVQSQSVFFAAASSDLTPEAKTALDRVASAIKKYPTPSVEVGGHTDSDGDEALNVTLSTNRANAVRDYLVNAGVESRRLSAAGFGSSKPRADNATPEGRAQNRRVEFVVKKGV